MKGEEAVRAGGCLCGAVRYSARGAPLRVGLCHCMDCRRESGSTFATFAIWPSAAFSFNGDIQTFAGRSFCPACGARVFGVEGNEAEVRLGSLDEGPSGLSPSYELWVKRRETWLAPLPGCRQFDEDRIEDG